MLLLYTLDVGEDRQCILEISSKLLWILASGNDELVLFEREEHGDFSFIEEYEQICRAIVRVSPGTAKLRVPTE